MFCVHAVRHKLAQYSLVLLLGAAACAPEDAILDGPTAAVTQGELDGSKFLLEKSRGFQPVAGTEVALRFVDGWLELYADCNGQGGRYEIRGSTLLLSELGTNAIGCRPERHAQDEWLATFFSSRPRIGRNGERVILSGSGATLSFLADPDLPLVGAAWSVVEPVDDERPSTAAESERSSIAFRPDGTLEVELPCSSGRGEYAASSNRITVSKLTYADRTCTSLPSFGDEQVKTTITNGVLGFAIDGRRLTLTRDKLSLVAIREAPK